MQLVATAANRAGVCAAVLLASAVLATGCTNFRRFKPYTATIAPRPGASNYKVKLNVWNAPEAFSIYERRADPARYATPIREYIAGGLQQELSRAGFGRADKRGGPRTLLVDVYVNQFDLGYEKRWWTTAVAGFGYSRVTTIALADVTVEITLPGSGERYRRRFVSRADDHSRLLWIGLFLPIIPVPVSGFYDEEAQIHEVATDCFRRVVGSVDELVKAYGT